MIAPSILCNYKRASLWNFIKKCRWFLDIKHSYDGRSRRGYCTVFWIDHCTKSFACLEYSRLFRNINASIQYTFDYALFNDRLSLLYFLLWSFTMCGWFYQIVFFSTPILKNLVSCISNRFIPGRNMLIRGFCVVKYGTLFSVHTCINFVWTPGLTITNLVLWNIESQLSMRIRIFACST